MSQSMLLDGFSLERGEIWLHESGRWVEAQLEDFESLKDRMGDGIACLELTKRPKPSGRGEH